MSMFNESNTVEAYVRDLLAGPIKAVPANTAQEPQVSYGPSPKGIGWRYAAPADVPRQIEEVLVESWLRDALIRLNPEIYTQPDRADEVLYKLRAIVLSVRSDGLIRANEEMTAWLRGERSMPFGHNDEHVPVRLIDLDDFDRTSYIVTQQYTYRAGPTEQPADLVLLVNGIAAGADRGQDAGAKSSAGWMGRCRCMTTMRSSCRSCSSATCFRWRPRARTTATAPSGCR